jgi:chemotaxis protein MotB
MASFASDESGVILMPADGRRRRDPTRGATSGRWGRRIRTVVPYVIVILLVSGGAFGATLYFVPADPVHDPVPAANAAVADARKDAIDAEGRARSAETELAQAKAALAAAAATDQEREAQAAAQRKTLSGAAGKDGSVTQDGDAIKLELVDKVLFRVGEADLTPRGEQVLDSIAVALEELHDKQIWVQGHTDDSPIIPAEGVEPRYWTNWELSAARALTVVHYLQDVAGVDPRRLAAVAFGEHRPAAKAKARNRRIEIVLYPRHQLRSPR